MKLFHHQSSSPYWCRLGALAILVCVTGQPAVDSNSNIRHRRTNQQEICRQIGVDGRPRSDDCDVFINENEPLGGQEGIFGWCNFPDRGPKPPKGYWGRGCKVKGPKPVALFGFTVVARFFAIGDRPYDKDATTVDADGNPTFEGDDYNCMRTVAFPQMKERANDADFIVHVGDIKKGNALGNDPYCSDAVFSSRRKLFDDVEPDLDFFLLIGDNEWNECQNFSSTDITDPAKTRWREYFTTAPFNGFDRPGNLPSGVTKPTVVRQTNSPENFFFEYKGLAFIGITEPYGDTFHDSINANWISERLGSRVYQAIIFFGQAQFSDAVANVLASYYASNGPIPTLYVKGDDHPEQYCMRVEPRFPDHMLEVTVEAYEAPPLLISIVEKHDNYYFHVEETSHGCD